MSQPQKSTFREKRSQNLKTILRHTLHGYNPHFVLKIETC